MGELSDLAGVDERARRFSSAERRVVEFLAAEGRHIVAVAVPGFQETVPGFQETGSPKETGRRPATSRPDALVDGEPTDFAVLGPGDTSLAVTMALSRAARHAECAVVDARGSGLSQAAAEAGVRRFCAVPHSRGLRGWRVIGDGYDMTA